MYLLYTYVHLSCILVHIKTVYAKTMQCHLKMLRITGDEHLRYYLDTNPIVEVPWKFFRYDLILVMQQRFIVSVPNRPQTVKSVAWDHHDGNPIMPISFS